MPFQPYSQFAPTRITQQNLPHWRQEGTTYFVTCRMADSVPSNIAAEWRQKRDEWLGNHGVNEPSDLPPEFRLEYTQSFTDKFHDIIDAGHGECVLSRPECAEILLSKMIEGHGTCFNLGAWVIMPNHFHAIIQPARGSVLGEIIKHWKGGSGFLINKLLGRKGSLWLAEPFDHIIRSPAQWYFQSTYIARNPDQARLRKGFVLGFGSDAHLDQDSLLERIDVENQNLLASSSDH